MKHTKHSLLVILFLLCTCNVYGRYFRQLGLNDGLSNLSVLSICQDKLGRMWFGTKRGINVYDGVTVHNSSYFKNIYKNWDLLEGRITDIVSDKKGNLFFLNDGKLVKYNLEQDKFTHIKLSKNARVPYVFEGNLHFMVSDSLYMYNADKDSICLKEILPFSSSLISLAKQDDKLYMGTTSGLYVKEGNQTKKLLADVPVASLLVSSWGELWIGTENDGLYRLDNKGVLKKEILSDTRVINKQIRQIVEDDEHNIWFGTFKGLQVYHPKTDTYKTYTSQPVSGSLSHNSVFSLYFDQTKGLWIGTYYGGVNYLVLYNSVFSFYPYSDYANHHSFNHKIVGSIVESNDYCLWVATEGGGVNGYNRLTHQYTYITSEQKNSILVNNIKSLAYDKERDCLYIGTHMGGLSRYDIKQKKVYNYLTDTRHKKGPNDIIYKCIFDNDCLYVTAKNGFWKLDPRTDEFEFIGKNKFYQEFEIVDGYAWIAISYSMYRINLSDYSEVVPVLRETELNFKAKINKIRKSHDGLIYVVTDGNGVYVYDKNMHLVHNYTEENSRLISNYCFNLVETSKHRILITGNNGLSLLSPESKQFYNVEFQDKEKKGFALSTEGDLFVASDSTVFLSGIHGMVSCKEDDLLQKKEIDSRLHFSKVLINNHLVQPTDGTDILSKALPFTSTVDLAYNQNNITVYFSNPFYSTSNSSFNYSYKLEGFDSEWIITDQNRITYTDLAPGKYILKLCTQNLQDDTQGKEIGLIIVIHRPWFLSWGAMVVYVLVLSFIVYRFWKITLSRKILALSLQKEKEEKERIEDLNKMKLNFFTNISHDFRTPLTLIIGQVEMLLQRENVPAYFNKKLWNIHKNAFHMRLLITELLDFRKQEQGFLKLKVECTNAVDLVKSVYISFAELAQKRAIRYTFVSVEDTIDLWVDPIQMQKVVYNLISNAFKYTQNGHEIIVTVNKNLQNIEISVEDTGCGIPQKVLPLIFDHFYQVEGNSKKQILGTGIGLALVKGIVDSHHGTIKVESTEGVGSLFTVTLLKGNSHFTSEELAGHELPLYSSDAEELSAAFQAEWMDYPSEQTNEKVQANGEVGREENEDNEQVNNDLPKILLVEDDVDMLKMLEEIFSPSYLVYTATDGNMGYDKALEIHPDLVVSDVMMPVMSGKDMCYRIKNNLSLAFVPVVLLTAQSSDENIIKGYMFGADDYITKPFNVKLLLLKCNNLVKNRQELMKSFRDNKKLSLAKPLVTDSPILSTANQELVEKTIKIIKENFSNSSFNMNTLAYELNIGRSRMYTCIKESIGITPNELVLKLKFEEALRMLKEEPNYNISEISFRLGFSSPQYFTRSFKAFYGETPQAYRKKFNV